MRKNAIILSDYFAAKCIFGDGKECDFRSLPRPFYIIANIKSGKAVFEGSSAKVEVDEGNLLFIPLGETYISRWYGENAYCNSIFFSFSHQTDPLAKRSYTMQKIRITDKGKAEQVADIIDFLTDSANDGTEDFGTSSFEVMKSFFELCEAVFSVLPYSEKRTRSEAIKNAVEYIENHFSESFSVKHLADLCYLSESRFYHLFKQITGVSPITYKNAKMVNNAAKVLRLYPDMPIDELSAKCGFESSTYFRKVFKHFTGVSPSDFKHINSL